MTDTYHLTVRGYELDSYNHLNNAVYLNHFEQARWEFFHKHKLLEKLKADNLILVVTEVNIRYAREAKMFEELIINTQLLRKEPYLIFRQHTLNQANGLLVAKASFKTLFLDRNDRSARDIPHCFNQFIIESANEKE